MKPPVLAVVGAGTMGTGIAQLAAHHGSRVYLIDVDAKVLDRSVGEIADRLERRVAKGKLAAADRDATMQRIRTQDGVGDLPDVTLAIETVVEDPGVKRQVLAALEASVPPQAVLASNTSSHSITAMAEGLQHPARVVGMHFFNPAPVMPLVEVVSGEASDPSAVAFAQQVVRSWGKLPVLARDTPGFIVNRIARPYYLEAVRLLGEGVAGVDEIDAVLRAHGDFKMGPFELMDVIGLDVNLTATTSIYERLNRPARLAPHEIHQKLVDAGHLGRKTGRGFYLHDRESPIPAWMVDRRSFDLSPLLKDAIRAFCTGASVLGAGVTEQYVFCRIVGAIINEAGRAFGEGVASAQDIDTAMKTGTNYPEGPFAWADRIGHRTVRGCLKILSDAMGDHRYEPAAMFRS